MCDLILGAVGHVDQPLVEPALLDVAANRAQHQPVIPHLAQYATRESWLVSGTVTQEEAIQTLIADN